MGNLRKVTAVLVLNVLILGAFLSSSLVSCSEEGETMGMRDDGLVPDRGIPAIDTSAPVNTETATFALG
jgi:hypothetical protein